MQSPILLSTGALCRYPLERRLRFATRRITFADFSQQTAAHLADDLAAWRLDMDLLTDAEASDWLEFYRQTQGGAGLFTFLDPWDNCLKHSEAFENAVWIKGANFVIGKNYLTRSEEFDHTDWIKGGAPSVPVVTANNVAAPDGRITAEKIDFPATGVGEQNHIRQDVTTPPDFTAQQFTFSVFLRADSSISIRVAMADGVSDFVAQDANLTTSWQRFTVTGTTAGGATFVRAFLQNVASQAAKTVYAWGAQMEYGAAASDYTKTITAATELLIADPFWLQAPNTGEGSNPDYGASLNLNSALAKRGRQLVNIASSGEVITEHTVSINVGGSGPSRSKGIEFMASLYVKRQAASPPAGQLWIVPTHSVVSMDAEAEETTFTPSATWERITATKRFSASNPADSIKFRIDVNSPGTFYVFGAQLEAAGSLSKYKKTTAKSGVRPNCRFAEDEIEHGVTQFDHNSLSQLIIQEWNG